MKSIEKSQIEIINNFANFDNWLDKYQYIIDLGKKIKNFPNKWRIDDYKIKGCQSQVWMHVDFHNGKLHFDAVSDSSIVTGLIYLLLYIYNNRTPEEILDTDLKFIKDIALDQHLSPTRNNGLHAMINKIKSYAVFYQNKQ